MATMRAVIDHRDAMSDTISLFHVVRRKGKP